MRADARRNRQQLVDAARHAFEERGVDCSLDDIARRAGVGSGTLYRHFPTRDHLVLALMEEGLAELEREAGRLAEELPPSEALVAWLHAYVEHAARFRGLAARLVTTDLEQEPHVIDCRPVHEAGQELVLAAVAAGALAAPADPQDVLDLAAAVAWVLEQGERGGDHADRLLDLILGGLVGSSRSGS